MAQGTMKAAVIVKVVSFKETWLIGRPANPSRFKTYRFRSQVLEIFL
jgi:hypothetical protein